MCIQNLVNALQNILLQTQSCTNKTTTKIVHQDHHEHNIMEVYPKLNIMEPCCKSIRAYCYNNLATECTLAIINKYQDQSNLQGEFAAIFRHVKWKNHHETTKIQG